MRRAAETRVITAAAVPAFPPDPGCGDDTGRFDQLGFERTQFAGMADECPDRRFGDQMTTPPSSVYPYLSKKTAVRPCGFWRDETGRKPRANNRLYAGKDTDMVFIIVDLDQSGGG